VDVFEAIRVRASVRNLKSCSITEQELQQILDAGRRAPSGYNRQLAIVALGYASVWVEGYVLDQEAFGNLEKP
jgi:nitroreductase